MKTNKLIHCAFFATLTGIMSQLAVPVYPIPINMGILGVLLAGGILGKKYGTLSTILYIFIGILGVPVFSGFRGGINVIAGPTGGYIAGYIIVAFVTGAVCEKTHKPRYTIPFMLLGVVLCYILGTMWFCITTGNNFALALSMCVIPFVPGDIIKVILASTIIKKYIR